MEDTSQSRESRARSRLLPTEQWLVVAVVLAEELVHAVVLGKERKRPCDQPRAGKHVGIFDDGLVLQRAHVRSAESLDDMERLGRAIAADFTSSNELRRSMRLAYNERVFSKSYPATEGLKDIVST